jgi:diphthine-ammonia ligase
VVAADPAGRYAVAWSGGKDCMLALLRARDAGLDVRTLFCIYDEATERVRFHGVPSALLAAQAERLGLRILLLPTTPDGYEPVFLDGLRRLSEQGITGVIFGNVHLSDVRAWYEERVRAHGLEHVEPVWGEAPKTILGELLDRGVRARIVAADALRAGEPWLGREITRDIADTLLATPGMDPLGEYGEYHSFVLDGPGFSAPVACRAGARVTMDAYTQVRLED